MARALDQAHLAAKAWIDGLDARSVAASASLEELRETFQVPLAEEGSDPATVVNWLAEKATTGLTGSAGGRFFAWVIGGGLESALAADWLVSTWDQNAAIYACSPAASVIEEAAGEWLKELFDLPRESSFGFTTGCQLAHTTALAAARWAVLQRTGWDVENDGLFGAPNVRVLVSDQRHGTVERALRMLGFGRNAMRPLRTDSSGRVTRDALTAALDETDGPAIVVLNAADLNVGACDPFRELIPVAKQKGAWVHVDGAFGLFARASRRHRTVLEGLELADSWATDAHKWLNVPYDCGMAIMRDREAHRAAMTLSASYIPAGTGVRDQIDWNPEWSRRARGVPVYAALKELG